MLLVNITNDAWFQHSSAPYQHFAHLALRAIETRLPVVRSANTGICQAISIRSAESVLQLPSLSHGPRHMLSTRRTSRRCIPG